MRSWRNLALFVLLFAALSCKDSTDPNSAASFTGTFTGALSGKKSGPAYYELQNTGDPEFFNLFGWSADESMEFGIGRDYDGSGAAGAGIPPAGTYQFGTESGNFQSTMYFADAVLYSISGTLTITKVAEGSVRGSFNITYSSTEAAISTFVGTFNAKRCADC